MDIRYFYVTEQVGRKTIHVTLCPTEEMVGDFFTKPLQGSLFLKMRNYIMGNEEPGYQDLPRSVLRKYDSDDDVIWKQKFIGIRKYDSEASMNHNNATKDPEGSTKDVSSRNIQRTKRSKNIEDEGCERHDDDHNKQRGDKSVVVEPRSYRDVVVNGGADTITLVT